MRIIEKRKSCWLVGLDPGEDLDCVVEAVARASFELAKPAGISAITSFDPTTQWEAVRDHALRQGRSPADPGCLLVMDYVAGRCCKTSIVKGRKYLTVSPGDGREQEMETMYLLATKYIIEQQTIRPMSNRIH